MVNNKSYLMTCGVLAPSFAGVFIYRLAQGRIGEFRGDDILVFAAISIAAGYLSAKMLKDE